MKKTLIFSLIVLALLLSACSITFSGSETVQGSGKVTSESRDVSGFSSIEVAGSADVNVSFGDAESVVVEAEDNILPLIETNVQGGRLVIRTKPGIIIRTIRPIRVTVTMKSLEAASIPGSGNITITDLQADRVNFELPGSGNITATGAVDTVDAAIGGSGNILCGDLQAKSAIVKISGSGNITVYASENLEAKISGSGNVSYRGDPKVNQSVTGSGTVTSMP